MHLHRLRVRYVECDMQGHAFNAHYLTWCDIAHTEALREAVGPWPEVVGRGIDVVVAEARVRFRAPVRYDDWVDVACEVQPLGTTSMITAFTLSVGEDVAAEAELRHVCVDAATYAKTPWPAWFRAAFAG